MAQYCDELSMEVYRDDFGMENECDGFEMIQDGEDGFRMWQGLVGPVFTPSVSDEGVISWTNDGGLPNPSPVNIKGAPGEGLTIKGIVSTSGDLPPAAEPGDVWLVGSESPYEAFIWNNGAWVSLGEVAVGPPGADGTTFTPSVSAAGVISWTNDGGKQNPAPVNIKGPPGDPGSPGNDGTTFTPTVSSAGVISWTNDGGKQNPASVNIKGPQGDPGSSGNDGTTFTPTVSSAGVISWTNDGGKQNPASVNIKGPQGDPAPLPVHFSTTLSSLPATISDARILADTSTEESRVTDVEIATPSALASDLSWTTASGSVTFSGTMVSGGTTVISFNITRCEKQ